MSILPVEPYLVEILQRMEREGIRLIIAGGLGIYLKRRHVVRQIQHQTRATLFPVPEARSTKDIDAFLSLEVFLREPALGTARVRDVLSELGYVVHTPFLQFTKPVGTEGLKKIKLDLHARLPFAAEAPHIKVKLKDRPARLGRAAPIMTHDQKLHAYATPEAFAIDEGIQDLPLEANDPHGNACQLTVSVPHPFVSLCMKLRAALDHERREPGRRDEYGERHAFDVYLLMAMLDEVELEQARNYALHFSEVPEMGEIREAVTLFRGPDGPGCLRHPLIKLQETREEKHAA